LEAQFAEQRVEVGAGFGELGREGDAAGDAGERRGAGGGAEFDGGAERGVGAGGDFDLFDGGEVAVAAAGAGAVGAGGAGGRVVVGVVVGEDVDAVAAGDQFAERERGLADGGAGRGERDAERAGLGHGFHALGGDADGVVERGDEREDRGVVERGVGGADEGAGDAGAGVAGAAEAAVDGDRDRGAAGGEAGGADEVVVVVGAFGVRGLGGKGQGSWSPSAARSR
jgi:hypothetical protein